MLYTSAADWRAAPQKRILLLGMSGLGKTHISSLMRSSGDWFHYSIDYRIGTRYLSEYIADNFKLEAMKNPFLRELLMTDSVYIAANITFDNLSPVSTWLGKPGDPARGGLPIAEYRRRQALFHQAEVSALLDTPRFADRAEALYGYPHFICDTGGSICEWVDAENPEDPILTELARTSLIVWIEGSEAHTDELIRRFDRAPKPMAYQPEFLDRMWSQYLSEFNVKDEEVNPDSFIRYTYAKALAHRQPRYAAIADNWGIRVSADDVAAVRKPEDFTNLIARALEARTG